MKKLLGILVLGLLLNVNAIADVVPIKEKRLQCLHDKSNPNSAKKEDYVYVIFSQNDTVGELFKLHSYELILRVSKFEARSGLHYISLIKNYKIPWEINRQTGILSELRRGITTEKYKCEPVPTNFNPKKYLEDLAKKRLQKEKDKIKY